MKNNFENNEITNSLIKKINSIVQYLEQFDNIFKILINLDGNLTPDDIKQIAEITELFIKIRSEHGSLLIIINKFKESISEDSNMSDELINKQYTLSTFNSIIENISSIIQNIDFEYKKIALKFPKFINKKILTLILVINEDEHADEDDNKFKKIITDLNKSNPENVYKIVETSENKINIKDFDISKENLSLNVKKKPILFMLNDGIITEISLKENDSFEKLKQLLH